MTQAANPVTGSLIINCYREKNQFGAKMYQKKQKVGSFSVWVAESTCWHWTGGDGNWILKQQKQEIYTALDFIKEIAAATTLRKNNQLEPAQTKIEGTEKLSGKVDWPRPRLKGFPSFLFFLLTICFSPIKESHISYFFWWAAAGSVLCLISAAL